MRVGLIHKVTSTVLTLTIGLSVCLSSYVSAISTTIQDFETVTWDKVIAEGEEISASPSAVIRLTAGSPVMDGETPSKIFSAFNFMPETTCFSGQTGLLLSVENPQNTPVSFQVMFDALQSDSTYMRYYLYSGGDVQPLFDASGAAVTGGGILYSSISLPGGYRGTIKLPFDGFFNAAGQPASNGQIGMVMQMTFGMNNQVEQGRSVCIGNVSLYPNTNWQTTSLLNYDEITDETFQYVAGAYSAGYGDTTSPIASISLSPDGYNQTNALKIQGTAHASLATVAAVGSAKDRNGLRFYVKNLDTTKNQQVYIQFDDPNGERWIAQDKPAVYTWLNGTTFAGSANLIPAVFEGFVYIPFDCFTSRNFSAVGTDDFSELNIGVFIFELSPSLCTDFIVDEFSLVKNTNANVLSGAYWTSAIDAAQFVSAVDAPMTAVVERRLVIEAESSAVGSVDFPTETDDWTGKTGLMFDVCNTSSNAVETAFRFRSGDVVLTAASDLYAKFLPKSGAPFLAPANVLPAGFDGTVILPFSSFSNYREDMNLKTVSGVELSIKTDDVARLYFDNIRLTDERLEFSTPSAPDVIEDFNLWTDTASRLISKNGDPLTITLDTSMEGCYQSLRCEITGAEKDAVGIGNAGFVPSKTDWTGGQGLQISVRNLSDQELALRPLFQEAASGELWVPKNAQSYYLKNASEEPISSSVIYQCIPVPAHFDGVIQIPFSSFDATVEGLIDDGVLQTNNIGQLLMEFDTVNGKGCSMLLDDILLINEFFEVETPVPPTGDIVEDFDWWTNVESHAASRFGDPVAISLQKSGENQALKFDVTGAEDNPVGVGNIGFVPSRTDWSGAKGIQFAVKNPGASDVVMRFIFQEADSGELWVPKSQANYVLQNKDEEPIGAEISYQSLVIPSGFDGIVQLPFEAFAATVEGLIDDKVQQLGHIVQFVIEFDTISDKGKSLIIDDIALARSILELDQPVKPTGPALPLLENFNNWTAEDLSSRLTLWAEGNLVTTALTKEGDGGSQALKFTVGNPMGENPGVVILNGTSGDWSGYAGIKMYVKNPSDKEMAFRFQIEEGKGTMERFAVASNKIVVLTDRNGIVRRTATMYDSIILPARFEGMLEIPFNAFKTVWWDEKGDGELDLSSMGSLYFEFDCANFAGQSLVIDTIALFRSLGEVDDLPPVDTGVTVYYVLPAILVFLSGGLLFAVRNKRKKKV